MSDERTAILDALRSIALGQEDASGRAMASRVSALRRLELMTRPAGEAPPDRAEEQPRDWPVCDRGLFAPPEPSLWAMWRTIPSHAGWESGDPRERESIERWEAGGGRVEWEHLSRPFSRRRWQSGDHASRARALVAIERS